MSINYFFDTEFYEDGKTIDLISIGMVCEDGREYYAVNREAKLHLVSDWVRENVLVSLPAYKDGVWKTRKQIRDDIIELTSSDKVWYRETRPRPKFWAYYADYDWVVLCQLFGTMMDLPGFMPKMCMDIKQLAVHKGSPVLPTQEVGKHNALEDARWNKLAYDFLKPLPWSDQ